MGVVETQSRRTGRLGPIRRLDRRLPTLTPRRYARVATVALALLTLIVLTGASVRLTGSGLGCPDWPKCYGGVVPPLRLHALIEYANRLLTGVVGVAAIAASLLAFRRRPYRRDLAALAILLPLGVVCQAVLGGLTVRYHLRPGFVMGHYVLSSLILDAALALAWRAHHEPGDRPRSTDRVSVWATRSLLPLGGLTILVGTVATASGPHAGGAGTGDYVDRLDWRGAGTLRWAVERHGSVAALFGLLALATWVLARRRGVSAERRRPLAVVLGLIAAQGAVGLTQYALKLPSEIVWVHISLAVATQLAVLWAVAAAGRLVPHEPVAPSPASTPPWESVAR